VWAGGGAYQQWADALERWQAGDQVDLAALPELSPEDLTSDGFERLANRLASALSLRLQAWADALTRALGHAGDEFAVARALAHARWGLRPIRALAAHNRLPAELATQLLSLVDTEVRSAQQALDDQVEALFRSGADRRAVEARRRTIRDNPISVVTAEDANTDQPTSWPADPLSRPRRRIIAS
jgi:hypothetical protein